MTRFLLVLSILAATATTQAQEGPAPTQALFTVNSKTPTTPVAKDVVIKVDNRLTSITNLTSIPANGVQIALLIDDGLRTSVGRELNTLRSFITELPAGTEVYVGYMQNGRVVPGTSLSGFTADHATAAQSLRIPNGIPGISASPYFCLSDFVKHWPANAESLTVQQTQQPIHKARFVLMITNGVDPYNGSTSILNQNSPYVSAAVTDAQRAGVPVYSIFFSDAGFGRGRGNFSGQNYLSQLAQGTGGIAYFQGIGNPVSMAPFLKQFQQSIADTYVATFPVDVNKKMVSLKLATDLPNTKLRGPDSVRPGTVVSN
jgi:hypothetical protein